MSRLSNAANLPAPEADHPRAEASASALASHVGPTLKRLRKARGLSISDLARTSGVSVGMLSQIERDLSNPSLRVLTQIRQALGVPPSALFEPAASRVATDPAFVRRRTDHPFLDLGFCTKELLTAGAQSNLQLMLLHVPPGGNSGVQPVAYPAEKGGLMLEGEAVLRVGDGECRLAPGDSFVFDSAIPHAFHNPSRHTPAKLLWVIGKLASDPQI